jgi:hypothetical protein
MTAEHNDIHTLIEIAHYEAHADRKESKEFRRIKEEFHKEGAKCYIDNRCEGDIEIHHNIIEFAASESIDWEKVQKDYPEFKNVDSFKGNMLPLCTKHHRMPGYGIHDITYPIWKLQKYMNEEALNDFENAVEEELKKRKIKREGNDPSQPV